MISNLLSVAAEEAPICPAAQVKWRAQPARPMLQVANLGPREALPCCNVLRQYVRMKNDQVEDEEDEEASQDARNVAKDYLSVFDNQAKREVDKHRQKAELKPDVRVEVFLVPLAYAVANPGTVMIKGRDAPLAFATMLGAQRLIVLALPTVSELDVDSALGQVSFDR